jgi:hypothetical protein
MSSEKVHKRSVKKLYHANFSSESKTLPQVGYHWFHAKSSGSGSQDKKVWKPMSYKDSKSLETVYVQNA